MKKVMAGFVAGAISFGAIGTYAATSIDVEIKPLKYVFDGVEKNQLVKDLCIRGQRMFL
ncbi:MAG TPA: hypothetical protein GX497_13680 [Bacillus bacterium]|nr:hypothetical protein [Bacillus sp. (in: firmicutes)]